MGEDRAVAGQEGRDLPEAVVVETPAGGGIVLRGRIRRPPSWLLVAAPPLVLFGAVPLCFVIEGSAVGSIVVVLVAAVVFLSAFLHSVLYGGRGLFTVMHRSIEVRPGDPDGYRRAEPSRLLVDGAVHGLDEVRELWVEAVPAVKDVPARYNLHLLLGDEVVVVCSDRRVEPLRSLARLLGPHLGLREPAREVELAVPPLRRPALVLALAMVDCVACGVGASGALELSEAGTGARLVGCLIVATAASALHLATVAVNRHLARRGAAARIASVFEVGPGR